MVLNMPPPPGRSRDEALSPVPRAGASQVPRGGAGGLHPADCSGRRDGCGGKDLANDLENELFAKFAKSLPSYNLPPHRFAICESRARSRVAHRGGEVGGEHEPALGSGAADVGGRGARAEHQGGNLDRAGGGGRGAGIAALAVHHATPPRGSVTDESQ